MKRPGREDGRPAVSFRIRPARPRDKGAVYDVHTSSIRGLCLGYYPQSDIESWVGLLSPELYEDIIGRKEIIVAQDGGVIVGFGQMDPKLPLLKALYVTPARVRHRVGTRIAGRLEKTARDSGHRVLYLRSTLNAVPFYEYLGYVGDAEEELTLPNGVILGCIGMSKEI
jgi:putative acetyltransferase